MKTFLSLGLCLAATAACMGALELSLMVGLSGCAGAGSAVDAGADRDHAASDAGPDREEFADAPEPDALASDGPAAGDAGQAEPEPSCAGMGPSFAPILDGTGIYGCVRVGPAARPAAGMFPSSAGRAAPLAYVLAGSSDPTPDGTQMHPFATIDAALTAIPTVHTLLLSMGTNHPAPTRPFVRSIDLVGTGDRFTTIVPPATGTAGSPAYAIDAQGLGTNVTLDGLSLDGTSLTAGAVAGGVHVHDAASVTLHDVDVRHVARGVQAETAATVHTNGVIVQDCGVVGLFFSGASYGDLQGTEVARTGGPGIFATDSLVNVTVAWVHHSSAAGGVVLTGVGGGAVDRIDRLTAQDNTRVGVVFAAGVHAEVTLMIASGTHPTTDTPPVGGFGMVATGGANVVMDTTISADAAQGHGSWFSQNDSFGVVADGVMGTTPTDVELNGAMVRHNLGPGAIFQDGATGRQIGYSLFNGNIGAGAIVAGDSRVGLLKCNGFIANLYGQLRFESGTERLGDGLVLAYTGAASRVTQIQGSLFADNARYGAYVIGADVMLQTNMGLAPGGQEVGADATSMVSGYGAAPASDARMGDVPSAMESVAVPALATP